MQVTSGGREARLMSIRAGSVCREGEMDKGDSLKGEWML